MCLALDARWHNWHAKIDKGCLPTVRAKGLREVRTNLAIRERSFPPAGIQCRVLFSNDDKLNTTLECQLVMTSGSVGETRPRATDPYWSGFSEEPFGLADRVFEGDCQCRFHAREVPVQRVGLEMFNKLLNRGEGLGIWRKLVFVPMPINFDVLHNIVPRDGWANRPNKYRYFGPTAENTSHAQPKQTPGSSVPKWYVRDSVKHARARTVTVQGLRTQRFQLT